MDNYEDIINLEHHTSSRHPRMSIQNRAAQFAPFAALTGYSDAIKETARQTSKRIEIDDGLKSILNNKLQIINRNISTKPLVTFIYFIKDKKKSGGEYITITDKVKRIDLYNQEIIMVDKTKIPINDIIGISSNTLKI